MNIKSIVMLLILIFVLMPLTIEAFGSSLNFSPNNGTFFVGSTFDVSVFVNTGGDNINAVQADLKFDPQKLQIASPAAGRSFISVWVSQPTYSNVKGTASFNGGMPSPGINTSAGLVSTITFRAVSPGETTIYFLDSSQALLDDGKGTNILTSIGRGVYMLTIPPPEGPEVFSSTHPDQNKWYKNNNPTFSWVKEGSVSDFSFIIDRDSQGTPDNVPEGNFTSVSYSDMEDGVWYFHVKARKAEVWGGTSHYLTQIDTTPPAIFTPQASPSLKTSISQPLVSFFTTDALSGLDHFEIKVIDVTPGREEKEGGFFVETISPYRLPVLQMGRYLVLVRAFDKAGNWRDASIKLEIVPEGLNFSKQGVSVFGFFLQWWQVALSLFSVAGSATGLLLFRFKKLRSLQLNVKEHLEKRESELKKEAEKIKNITDKIE